MSIDHRTPSIKEMQQFVADYAKSRRMNIEVELMDEDVLQELYTEINSKYEERYGADNDITKY